MNMSEWNRINERFAELEARIIDLERQPAAVYSSNQPITAEAVTDIQPARRGRPPKGLIHGNS